MQSDAASLNIASDVRLDKARRTSLSERRMTARSFFFLLFFLRLIIVNLDVRAANIALGHGIRTANIG